MEKSDDFDSANRIAIVGMSGRFPGARSVDQFWRLLEAERTGTRWLSDEELLAEGATRAELADPNYVKAGNFLEDMECFDAGFFGFSPRDAAIMDPQHRHFLEVAWEALEDAGHMPEGFDGRIGVFAGSGMQAYLPYNLLSNPKLVEQIGLFLLRHTGNDKDFLTTRLSYLLNLQGPSVAVQTACSTGLVAVHQAVTSLMAMECDMAIAGGVTIDLPHRRGYHYQDGEILSPDGRCAAFDNDSQGTVFGSGCALVVLRRLEDALADGDDIRAVILGSAINNDGAQKAGYLAPSIDGQAEAAAEALAVANIDPGTVSYVEAHGTGTPVGDPIELAALSQAYGKGGKGFAGIGSVKTNIGHLDTAAGTASLIKVVQAMRHHTLPASLNYRTPNARFDIARSPFYVVDKTRAWKRGATPRRAGVNSVGVGGTNAHLILEEGPERAPALAPEGWRLLPFSARSRTALDGARRRWLDYLGRDGTPALPDIAITLQTGRRAFGERLAVAAKGHDDLAVALSGAEPRHVATGTAASEKPEIVFMFPGGGAQYPGAGAGLLANAAFRAAVEDCFARLPANAPADLREVMFERTVADKGARAKLEMSAYAIPALFILEYAYARLWQSWGIEPAAILAHSVGEYAGAVVAGAMSVGDALRIVTLRGKVMDAAPAGAMTVVPAPTEVVEGLVGDRLDIAAFNAPNLCVVSGEVADIEALEARLLGTEYEAKRVRIKVAAHSRILDGQLETFRSGFEGVRFTTPEVPFVSSLRGDWGREDDFASADYWVRHLRTTVRFTQAVSQVLASPNRILLEVGPHHTLSPLADMSEGAHRPVAIVTSGRQPNDEDDDMAVALTAAGRLWAHGIDLDWAKLPGAGGRRVSLPTYAFERERHWIEPGKGMAGAVDTAEEAAPRIERIGAIADWFEAFDWRETPIPLAEPRRVGAWLVFAGDDPVSEAVRARLARRGETVVTVRAGAGFAATDGGFILRPDAPEDYEALFDALGAVPARILHLWPLTAGGQAQIFDSAFALCRTLQTRDIPEGLRLAFATTGGAAVGGEAVARPELATLLGPVRVAPREIPGLAAQVVDFEPQAEPRAVAAALIEEQDVGADADRVAYRGRRRFTEARVRLAAPLPEGHTEGGPSRLKDGGVYVITGGLGGIGLELARHLGTSVRGRVALIGRTAMSEPADWDATLAADAQGAAARCIRAAREIEAAGGTVRFVAADVTDRAALAAALAAVRAGFGGIDGVFHAAGAIADAPLSAKSLAEAHAVMAPKVEGGRLLAELLPPGTLDFFAVFSSSSVQIAPAGQVDYIAANAYLEALAGSRPDGLAIAWGIWRDIGMAARAYGRGTVAPAGAHPLLGVREDAADGAIRFTAAIDPAALWVLTDHHVGGVAVLPGTAYVEILRAAFTAVTDSVGVTIEGLNFETPMAFEDGAPRHVRTTLQPAPGGGFEAVVESAPSADAEFVEHARALVRPAGEAAPPAELAAIRGLPASGRRGHPGSTALIQFGPRWQVLGDIRLGVGTAEAEAVLPTGFAADLDTFAAHPAMVDMAATIGLNLLPESSSEQGLYAPMSVERITVLAPLTPTVVSRARLVDHQPERLVRFDCLLESPDGRPLMILEGLDMRFVPAEALVHTQGAAGSLTEQMLARGIMAADAPEVFARTLAAPVQRLLVSSIPVSAIRARIAHELRAAARPARARDAQDGRPIRFANPVEEKIASLFAGLLGGDAMRPEDDFFQVGGHSLLSVRLFAKIRQELGVSLPMSTLFRASTVRALAARVIEERPDLAPADAASEVADAPLAAEAADARPEASETETTEGQREIFSAILIDPEVSKAYNLVFSLKLDGPLDPEAMTAAVGEVFNRHDSLRSRFDADGQRLHIDPPHTWQVPREDLATLAPAARDARLAALREAEVETPVDLLHGPVARARLITLAPGRHELLITVHHIVCDGWSIGVLMKEIHAAYSARAAGTAPAFEPAQRLADFVTAEKAWRQGPEAKAHEAYWLARFAGEIPVMDLMTDRPRPAVKTVNGARVDSLMDPALARRLRAVAKAEGSTLQNLVLAAFQLYLARITGQRDIVIGLPSSGQLSFGMESVVGHCVNFLPIRSRIDDATPFKAFLGELRLTLMDALDHQNYTYGNLIKALRLPRDPSRVLLVPVIFNIDNLSDINGLKYDGLKSEFVMHPRAYEHFEIFFNLLDEPDRVRMDWAYNTDLFDRVTIERHLKRFVRLLEGLAEAPETPLGATGRFLAALAPGTAAADDPGASGPQTILEVFAATARRHADRTAVRFGDRTMDYATLDARSDALAALLWARGVRPGALVGISSRRCPELAVAVMGVLKTGAGYVPFDTNLPDERLAFMAEDTGIRILLGDCEPVSRTGVERIAFADFPTAPAPAPAPGIDGAAIAYVMFTSGTTGRPKGVVLPHRSVIRLLVDTDWVELGPETKTLHSSAFAFDTSIIDIFGALLHGGELVIPPDGALTLAALGYEMQAHGVNTLWLTSGLFHAMADERPQVFARVRQVIVGGDIVSPVQVAKVMAACPGLRVINGYGPTENNVTTAHRITRADIASGNSLPIGPAISGTQVFILDETLQPVEPGVQGELCCSGRGLALGYWNRPDLTAEKFVQAPWDPGLTVYRTGDLAADPGNGILRFFGRMDTQVKIRGFRVELAEVEAALESHPEVQLAAAVASVPEGRSDKVIIAYFIPTRGRSPSRAALMAHLKGILPEFALPAFVQPLERIPLNANGKVDRRALPPIDLEAIAGAAAAPATELERGLVEMWRGVLGLDAVGVDANFFELGGHSLLAVRLFERIREKHGLELPISTLFQNSTVRDLAAVIEAKTAGAPTAPRELSPEEDWDTTAVIHSGPAGSRARPFFIVGGIGGNVNNLYKLGTLIGEDRPVIGLQTRGILGHTLRGSVEEMAEEHVRYIRGHQPNGPYFVAGYSGGGLIALEMARYLRAQGEEVANLFILDTYAPGFGSDFQVKGKLRLGLWLRTEWDLLRMKGLGYTLERIKLKLRGEMFTHGTLLDVFRPKGEALDRLDLIKTETRLAARRYRGGTYDGTTTLLYTSPLTYQRKIAQERDPTLGWGAIVTGSFETVFVPGDHRTMLWNIGARQIAREVNARIGAAEAALLPQLARAG